MSSGGGQARRLGPRALGPILRFHPWAMPAIVLLGVTASLAEGVGISLFLPLFQDSLTDGSPGQEQSWITWLKGMFDGVPPAHRAQVVGSCILAAVALRAVLLYVNTLVLSWLDARVGHRLRAGIFDQYLTVEYRFIENSRFGDLLNTLDTETWRTNDALAALVAMIIAACTALVHLSLLLMISARLTGAIGIALLLISLVVRVLTQRVENLGAQITRSNAALATRMVETLKLMPVIRAFNHEADERARADRASLRMSELSMKLAVRSGAVRPVYEILSGAVLVGVIVIGLSGPGDIVSLAVFMFVLYRLQPAVTDLDSARTGLRALLPAVEEVTAMLDRSNKAYLRQGRLRHEELRDAIVMDDVTFRYSDHEEPALDHVHIRIPVGRVTALVGPSGGGKSTLIKLLLRFYDPSSGTVHIDGTPLPEFDLASWREHVALVGQDVALFNTTVTANIAYGAPAGADRAEVEEAARLADAHDFISDLPNGYDTEVGDHGTRLSGGQQQRVTLARAMIRDPQLLVLDEATNSLDSRSEQVIQDALDRLSDGRTVVIVAHRFSTIQRADHIVVLERGRVVEQGDREALLARHGLFHELHGLQQEVLR